MSFFNFRKRRVGGITFLTIGRFNFSWCVSKRLNKCFEPCSGPCCDMERARAVSY
jgi:hypothetical protein